jgi:hypothetical protein
LQLVSSYRPVPAILQCLRIAKILCDFLFDVRLRHHFIQRWLGTGVRVWPDAVTPVNVLDRSLVSDALGEAQASDRTESRVILRRDSLEWLLRDIDRPAEGDNYAPKKQRGRADTKNVSVNFVVRFHCDPSLSNL